jgi:HD-GYP domain-containing protein (c-di-GMP phosphodiesterase class II)
VLQRNGQGLPNGWSGEQIPLAARIVFVARDVEILHRLGGIDRVLTAVRNRRGAAYDPAVADAFLSHGSEIVEQAEVSSPWDEVLQREPNPQPLVNEGRVDAILEAFADFVDLKSPFTPGHSREVATLAAQAAPDQATTLHRAGRSTVRFVASRQPGEASPCRASPSTASSRAGGWRLGAARHVRTAATTRDDRPATAFRVK